MILYKYMSLERKNFWTDYKLRFTQPSAFNDPFDCLPSYSFIPERLMPEHSGFGELAALFYGIEKDSSQFNDDTAIFCMSQVWDSILMWAHYADSHKGFVVGFDMSHSFFDFEKPFGTRKVKYCKSRPKSTEINIMDRMYYKLDVWSYEQEWRLCKDIYKADETINNNIYLFRLPKESVKSVYFGICMPENEKMDMYQKASREGIQCYQVMRNYQTFDLHAMEFEDFLSLQCRYHIIQRDLEQENTPSKPPSKTLRTADIVTRSLERCAEILSSIIEQTYQKSDNKIDESNIKEYSDAIKVHVKALEEINCLPDAFHLCDTSISQEVYETRIKHIQKNFDNCIYHVIGLIQYMMQSAQGRLPDTEEYLSTKINEKIGGAVSSFASSVSWAAKVLEEQEFRKIIAKITFEEDFQKMHANDEGWQNGQKIVKRWYEKKQNALEISNITALERYRTTRLNWVRLRTPHSNIGTEEIESYIKKYCQYEQGTLPMLKKDIKGYSGNLPQNTRKKIHELIFFFDVVQSNDGFLLSGHSKDEEKRRRTRILNRLINGGIEKDDAEKYMADSFFPL